MSKFKKFLNSRKGILTLIILPALMIAAFLGARFSWAASWLGPTSSPGGPYTINTTTGLPNNNVPALLNSGSASQGILGNFGIGRTAPEATLDIHNNAISVAGGQETIRLRGNYDGLIPGSGSSIDFIYAGPAGTKMARIRSYTFGAGAAGLAFDTGVGAPATRMVIGNTGNVGIGAAANPEAKLAVSGGGITVGPYGAFTSVGAIGLTNDGIAKLYIWGGNTTFNPIISSTANLRLGAGGVDRMLISSSTGNVSIGTAGALLIMKNSAGTCFSLQAPAAAVPANWVAATCP